jgi:hypothetical protein
MHSCPINSVDQSPSSEANSRSAGEIPRLFMELGCSLYLTTLLYLELDESKPEALFNILYASFLW